MKTVREIFYKHFNDEDSEDGFLELQTKQSLKDEVMSAIEEALGESDNMKTIHQFSEDNIFISEIGKTIILDSGSEKIYVERDRLPEFIKRLTDIQNGKIKTNH